MLEFVKKIFGTAQGRLLKKYGKIVTEVNRWEEQFQSLYRRAAAPQDARI